MCEQVRTTKLEYDSIASRMTEELNRYQKERSRELNGLLKDFALTQVRVEGRGVWGGGRGAQGRSRELNALLKDFALAQVRVGTGWRWRSQVFAVGVWAGEVWRAKRPAPGLCAHTGEGYRKKSRIRGECLMKRRATEKR